MVLSMVSLVYVYSQDASVLGGSVGEMHAKKIANLYDMAMKTGAPVIGLIDSTGLRLQESVDGLKCIWTDLYEAVTCIRSYSNRLQQYLEIVVED